MATAATVCVGRDRLTEVTVLEKVWPLLLLLSVCLCRWRQTDVGDCHTCLREVIEVLESMDVPEVTAAEARCPLLLLMLLLLLSLSVGAE